ncbi:autotransporter outer membrane beta-barrel domain-containing protein [Flaviaesturariibacter terrae]
MKRIVLVAIALLSLNLCEAQLQKGRVLLGGTVSFSNTESRSSIPNNASYTKASTTYISPLAGVFIRPNLLAGVSLLYGKSKTTNGDAANPQSYNSDTYGGGFLLRRYFPLGANFYFYVDGGLGYRQSNATSTVNSFPVSTTTMEQHNGSLSVNPGVAFNFGKRIVLETSLSNFLSLNYFRSRNRSGSQDYRQKTFSGGIGAGGSIPLNIGFNILLGK